MLRKIVSISLAFLLLVSTSGVAYAQHFCGNYLAKTLFTLDHDDDHLHCGMEMQNPPSCDTDTNQSHKLSRKNCCENHFSKIEIDDNYNGNSLELHIDKVFLAAYAIVFVAKIQEDKATINSFKHYKPPIPDKDIPVLYQTFLI